MEADSQIIGCIEKCLRCCITCWKMHEETTSVIDIERFRSLHLHLVECAEICRTTASFLRWNSAFCKAACALCAETCERCAWECARIPGDEQARRVLEACEQCAGACRVLTQHLESLPRSSAAAS